ncbi:hypothetical protein OAO18_00560 [Francisellaceae bacterium]|nr:hypothetical protein [Francisellaceae bacterium]
MESFNPIMQAQSDINQTSTDIGLNNFTKTYGHPEIVQLDQFNSDHVDASSLTTADPQYINLHLYSPQGGYGHKEQKIDLGISNQGSLSYLAYQVTNSTGDSTHWASYNKVIALNGDAHNTYDKNTNKVLNRKMVVAAFVYNQETQGEPTFKSWGADCQTNYASGTAILHAPNQIKLFYQSGGAVPATAGNGITSADDLGDWESIDVGSLLSNSPSYVALVDQYPELFRGDSLNLSKHIPRDIANQFTIKSINSINYCPQLNKINAFAPTIGDACRIIHGTGTIGGIADFGFIIHWDKNNDMPQVYFYGFNYMLKNNAVQALDIYCGLLLPYIDWTDPTDCPELYSIIRSGAFNHTMDALTCYHNPNYNNATSIIVGCNFGTGASCGESNDVTIDNESIATRLIDLDGDYKNQNDCFMEFWNCDSQAPQFTVTSDGSNNLVVRPTESTIPAWTGLQKVDELLKKINAIYNNSGKTISFDDIRIAFENKQFKFTALAPTNGTVDYLETQMVMAIDQGIFQFNAVFNISPAEKGNYHALNLDMIGFNDPTLLNTNSLGLSYITDNSDPVNPKWADPISFNDPQVSMFTIGVNHQGKVNIYTSVQWANGNDQPINRLYSFAQDPGSDTGQMLNYVLVDGNIKLLYQGYTVLDQGMRVLSWDNYFHDQEVVYVRANKKSAQRKAAFQSVRKLNGLNDGTNDTEYVYASKDYIAKKWHVIPTKIQASQDDQEVWLTSSVQSKAHHIELFAVNSNGQIVSIDNDNQYVEVRFDTPVTIVNNSNPRQPENIVATRLNSYFIKPVNNKVYLNVFMDDADTPHGLTMYYRLVDKSQFNADPDSGGTWSYNSSTSQTQSWYCCNISYQGHARMSNGYSSNQNYFDNTNCPIDSANDPDSIANTPNAPSNFSSCKSYDDVIKNNIKQGASSSSDDIKNSMTNGYDKASTEGKPTNNASQITMLGASVDNKNPLNGLLSINGQQPTVTAYSNGALGSIWSDIGHAISDAWNAIKHEIEETIKCIEKDISNIADQLGNLIKDIATGNWDQIFADIGACLMSIAVLVVDCVSLVIDVITIVALAVITFLLDLLGNPGQAVIDNLLKPADITNKDSYISSNVITPNLAKLDFSAIDTAMSDIGSTLSKGYHDLVDSSSAASNLKLNKRLKNRLKSNILGQSVSGLGGSSQTDLNNYYDKSVKINYVHNELSKNIPPDQQSMVQQAKSFQDTALLKSSSDYFNSLGTSFQNKNGSKFTNGFGGTDNSSSFSVTSTLAPAIGDLDFSDLKISDFVSNGIGFIQNTVDGGLTNLLQLDLKSVLPGGLIQSIVPSGLQTITLEKIMAVEISLQIYVMVTFAFCTNICDDPIKFISSIEDLKPFSSSVSLTMDNDTLKWLNIISQIFGFLSGAWGILFGFSGIADIVKPGEPLFNILLSQMLFFLLMQFVMTFVIMAGTGASAVNLLCLSLTIASTLASLICLMADVCFGGTIIASVCGFVASGIGMISGAVLYSQSDSNTKICGLAIMAGCVNGMLSTLNILIQGNEYVAGISILLSLVVAFADGVLINGELS